VEKWEGYIMVERCAEYMRYTELHLKDMGLHVFGDCENTVQWGNMDCVSGISAIMTS
jgi:hypothetical protein